MMIIPYFVLILIVSIVVFALPALFSSPMISQSELANLGNWLAGSLTPISVLVAGYGLKKSSDASTQAIEKQNESNEISRAAVFIDNLDRFAEHVDYMCFCALIGFRESREKLPKAPAVGLGYLLAMLRGHTKKLEDMKGKFPEIPKLSFQGLDVIRGGKHYLILKREIDGIIKFGGNVGFLEMLDGRIKDLQREIEDKPPTLEKV